MQCASAAPLIGCQLSHRIGLIHVIYQLCATLQLLQLCASCNMQLAGAVSVRGAHFALCLQKVEIARGGDSTDTVTVLPQLLLLLPQVEVQPLPLLQLQQVSTELLHFVAGAAPCDPP